MHDLALANVIIAVCGILLIAVNFRRLQQLPGYRRLLASYFVLCIGWSASLFDEGQHHDWLNLVEHASYFVSLTFLSLWVPSLARNGSPEHTP